MSTLYSNSGGEYPAFWSIKYTRMSSCCLGILRCCRSGSTVKICLLDRSRWLGPERTGLSRLWLTVHRVQRHSGEKRIHHVVMVILPQPRLQSLRILSGILVSGSHGTWIRIKHIVRVSSRLKIYICTSDVFWICIVLSHLGFL